VDLGDAIDLAIKGDRDPLFGILTRGSKLPGTVANDALAGAFADLVGARGAKAEAFAIALTSLHADEAPGGTQLEFLPMCGALALGALATKTKDLRARKRLVAALHEAAEDLRFRVRDAVPVALEKIGATQPEWLMGELSGWMDGFFHGAAVLRAIVRPGFLHVLMDADAPVARLDEAWGLVKDASRSTSRYPGFKALIDELVKAPTLLALRFGAPVFDVLEARARTITDPALREVLERSLRGDKLASRFSDDVKRVRRALDETAPPVRDPRYLPRPTRRRGKR
jgi:hypothetical protein